MSKEMVDHPKHYNRGKFEAIDIIEALEMNFNLGNAQKYLFRAGHKDDMIQDLEKAKTNYDKIPEGDFNTKYTAEKRLYAAENLVRNIEFELMSAEEEQNILMYNKMIPYANTVNNWHDGAQVEYFSQRAGVSNRIYTCVTLPNGEKAYEYNGEYFSLGPNGEPSSEYNETLVRNQRGNWPK